MKISIFFGLMIAALTAEAADYGSKITTEQCQKIVEEYLKNNLKDPGSAELTYFNSGCIQSERKIGRYGKKRFGYMIAAKVNAKNSYGGYTGNTIYQFLIKDGVLLAVDDCGPNFNSCDTVYTNF